MGNPKATCKGVEGTSPIAVVITRSKDLDITSLKFGIKLVFSML